MSSSPQKLIILGAAGRDFHDFNCYWRERLDVEVICFTAAQIPDIAGRTYPPELAGPRYPKGVPIHPEADLPRLIREHGATLCALAYSDLSHEEVMHKASLALAAGANFILLGRDATMLRSVKPVIAVGAVRTGCGKSQTSRFVAGVLKSLGQRVAVVRHPMPYGDLRRQICQRFATLADLDLHQCTIEEREEYEPHIQAGNLVFAGIDYALILSEAEREADVVLWDGGNNDMPFFRPDLFLVVTDTHRPGHEVRYHPGETNLRSADVVIVNKMNTAQPENIELVRANIDALNPRAEVALCDSTLNISGAETIRGKRVLCIEDGPTVTHGQMSYGAAFVAARAQGAAEIVDPRPAAVGSIRATFANYPHCEQVLPAMGYGERQIHELEQTINATACDVVLVGTPIDLARMLKINKPALRVGYELSERNPGQIRRAIESMLLRAAGP